MFEKLKNYPHVYSKHYDIKPGRKPATRTSVGAVPLNVGGPSGNTTSTINLTSTPQSFPSTSSFASFREKMSPKFSPVSALTSKIGNFFSKSKSAFDLMKDFDDDDDLAETQKLKKHRKGRDVSLRAGVLSPMSTRQQAKSRKLDLKLD